MLCMDKRIIKTWIIKIFLLQDERVDEKRFYFLGLIFTCDAMKVIKRSVKRR